MSSSTLPSQGGGGEGAGAPGAGSSFSPLATLPWWTGDVMDGLWSQPRRQTSLGPSNPLVARSGTTGVFPFRFMSPSTPLRPKNGLKGPRSGYVAYGDTGPEGPGLTVTFVVGWGKQ